jgi:hypothetical protein
MNYLDTIATTIQLIADADWQDALELPLYRNYALLALTKGEATTNEDVHNAWVAWASSTKPKHPSLIPYRDLTPEVQALDTPYTEAIRCVAAELRRQGVNLGAGTPAPETAEPAP